MHTRRVRTERLSVRPPQATPPPRHGRCGHSSYLTSRAGPPLDAGAAPSTAPPAAPPPGVGDRLVLHGRTADTGLTATIDQRSLLGEVTVAGTVRPFAAQIATGVGGLFQSRRTVEGITTRIGWIVLPDGTQVGVRRSNDERGPAPPLDPVTLRASEDGHPIPVERVSRASVVLGS